MPLRRIRVLVVDDSALARKVLTESLAHDPEIEVVGTAADPYAAREKIIQLQPDVLTLDIEMPRMDGLSFLRLLMKHRPMPVIIISSLTTDGSAKALEALQAGAVDVLPKPAGSYLASTDGTELAAKIKAAFQAKVRRHTGGTTFARRPSGRPSGGGTSPPFQVAPSARALPTAQPRAAIGQPLPFSDRRIILIGASTGGTEALKEILTNLPATISPICIVQHIPALFSRAFADRLNQLCAFEVREAQQGDRIRPGVALIAPGGQHMVIQRVGSFHQVELNEGPLVHHQRPAVDVLFDSAVRAGLASQTLAMLLTGMGTDGAAGLLKLKEAGATTVAQNEQSCVVFGMPREAIRLGAAQTILPLDQMAPFIERHAGETSAADTGP